MFAFPFPLLPNAGHKGLFPAAPEPVSEPPPLQTLDPPVAPPWSGCFGEGAEPAPLPVGDDPLYTPWADSALDPDESPASFLDPYTDQLTDPFADPFTDPIADPYTDPFTDQFTDPVPDQSLDQSLAAPDTQAAPPARGALAAPQDMWADSAWMAPPAGLALTPSVKGAAFNTAISPVMEFDAGKKSGVFKLATDTDGDEKNYRKKELISRGLGQQFTHEVKETAGPLTETRKWVAGAAGSLSYESSQEEAADGPMAGQNSRSFKVGGAISQEGVKGELERSVGAGNQQLGFGGNFDTSNGSFMVKGTAGGGSLGVGRGESGGLVIDQSFKLFDDEQGKKYKSFGWSLDPAAGRYGINIGNERWKLGAGVLDHGGYLNVGTDKWGVGVAAQFGDETNISVQGAVGDIFSGSAGVSVADDRVSANLGAKVAGFGLKGSGTWIDDRKDVKVLPGAPGEAPVAETSVTNGFAGRVDASIPFLSLGGGGGESDVVRHRQQLPAWLGALPGAAGVAAQSMLLDQMKAQAPNGPQSLSDVDVMSMADQEGYSFDHDGNHTFGGSLGADLLIASAKLEAKHEAGQGHGTDIDRAGDEYTVQARQSEYEKDSVTAGIDITLAEAEEKITTLEVNGQAVQWSAKGPDAAKQVQRFVETGLIPGADKQDGLLASWALGGFQEKDREVKQLEALQSGRAAGEAGSVALSPFRHFVAGPLQAAREERRKMAELLNAGLLAGADVGEELAPGVTLKSHEKSELHQREEQGSAGLLWWETEWSEEDAEERRQKHSVGKAGDKVITDQRRERHDDEEGEAEQLAVEVSSDEEKAALSFTSRERIDNLGEQFIKPSMLFRDGLIEPFDDLVETKVSLKREDIAAVAKSLNEGAEGKANWISLQTRVLTGINGRGEELGEKGVDVAKLVMVNSPEQFAKLAPAEQKAWLESVAHSARSGYGGSMFDALAAVGTLDAKSQQRALTQLVDAARDTKKLPPELEQAANLPFVAPAIALAAMQDQMPAPADLGAEWSKLVKANPDIAELQNATTQRRGSQNEWAQEGMGVEGMSLCYKMGMLDDLRRDTLRAAHNGGGSQKVEAVLKHAGESAATLWAQNFGNKAELIRLESLLEGTATGEQLKALIKSSPF